MKSKLKNLILLFAFSAFSCNTFAQTEWITELPVFGYAYSMLRTKDSCYAVLKRPAYYNEDSTQYIYNLQLTKVNPESEIVWYKTVFSDTLSFTYLSFIQLSNEDFFITGRCHWCPFYAIVSKDGELKNFNRLDYYLNIPDSYSCFWSPVEISNSEIWVLGGFSNLYITKINLNSNEIIVDSTAFCLQNVGSGFMNHLSNNNILITTGSKTYIIDTNQNIINHKEFNFKFSGIRYKPFHINHFDSLYYFYGQTLDPYPNERYGFLVLNQQLDSVKFIDNFDFYPNQSQVEYPRILDFDFPKPDNITMTGYIYWYYYQSYELPFILSYNMAKDSVEYFHAYQGSVTRYSINLLKEDSAYVMLHAFQGNPGFVFLLKEKTDTSAQEVTKIYANNNSIIEVYPNPVSDILTISCKNTVFSEVLIIDSKGQQIKQIFVDSIAETAVNVQDLAIGEYSIIIETKEGLYIVKIIKI